MISTLTAPFPPRPETCEHISTDVILTCGPRARFNLTHWGRVLAARYGGTTQ